MANDTLYTLHLIYEVPQPSITATGDCIRGNIILKASAAGKNAISFDGTNGANSPVVKINAVSKVMDGCEVKGIVLHNATEAFTKYATGVTIFSSEMTENLHQQILGVPDTLDVTHISLPYNVISSPGYFTIHELHKQKRAASLQLFFPLGGLD